MAKKPTRKQQSVLFDVIYADGTQLSNRRVPAELLTELESEDMIRAYIEGQDREIADRSGRSRGEIKTIVRSG